MRPEGKRFTADHVVRARDGLSRLPGDYQQFIVRAGQEINWVMSHTDVGLRAQKKQLNSILHMVPTAVLSAFEEACNCPSRTYTDLRCLDEKIMSRLKIDHWVSSAPSVSLQVYEQENFPADTPLEIAIESVVPSAYDNAFTLEGLDCAKNILFICPAERQMRITKSSPHTFIVSEGRQLTEESFRQVISPMTGSLALFDDQPHGVEIHCGDCPDGVGCVLFNYAAAQSLAQAES